MCCIDLICSVGLLVVTIWLELCSFYSIAPVVTTTSIFLSSNKIQNGDILLAANPGPPGKMATKTESIDLSIVDTFWPGVNKHHQQNHGPLVLSASHTSTVAEELSAVLGVMQSLPRTRHVVTQFIVNQLDSIPRLISSTSSSLSTVSMSGILVCIPYGLAF